MLLNPTSPHSCLHNERYRCDWLAHWQTEQRTDARPTKLIKLRLRWSIAMTVNCLQLIAGESSVHWLMLRIIWGVIYIIINRSIIVEISISRKYLSIIRYCCCLIMLICLHNSILIFLVKYYHHFGKINWFNCIHSPMFAEIDLKHYYCYCTIAYVLNICNIPFYLTACTCIMYTFITFQIFRL